MLGILKTVKTQDYNALVKDAFSKIYDLFENQTFKYELDSNDSVISYKVKGIGEYVINKQPPLKQIWSSSPLTGPKRFILENKKWYDVKNKSELINYLSEETKDIKHILNKNYKL